ncbi:hypothetical protein PanWU01x14_115540 [Parasponia andersonii]|uniref:Uncharacterized protein n=1 Tax=Parasponia andersonii TaxID=3476 RepID=A0A2P5CWV2_PARAD|nr:hypothetical protein PanWU01x14_115540 [Parasponia andersonii]
MKDDNAYLWKWRRLCLEVIQYECAVFNRLRNRFRVSNHHGH